MNKIKDIARLLPLLLLMLLTTQAAWGQTNYSGIYYIGAVTHGDTPADNFYLCPTVNWKYYQSSFPYYTDTNNGQPFLTTYKCRGTDGYDAKEAVWYIEKHPTLDYYYIKHASDNKYLTYNASFLSNVGRARVHLEDTPEDDYALFKISYNSTKKAYDIISKYAEDNYIDPDNNKARKYLNVNKSNQQSLEGTNADKTTPFYSGGIIGLWTAGATETSGTGSFFLEEALSIAPPTITNNFTTENTFTITAAEGATIYYTTDGTTPTTSTTTTGTISVNITQTEDMTVIKAIAKAASDPVPTPVVTYILPVCQKPVINASGGNITITCTTAGATIHYTTDGTPATTSSPTYNGSFAQGDATTIRAVATKAGYLVSSEATLMPATPVSSSSEMTDMNGNYLLTSSFTSSGSVGTSANPFRGTIDGNWIPLSLSHPLVAYADGATIKNVIIDSVSISSGTNVGAICGEATGDTRIYNCGVLDGSVEGENNVGGIVGLLDGRSRVINCYSYANITDGSYCGGIVGYNNVASTSGNLQTMVMNCMFYGNIEGDNAAPIYGGKNIHNKYASADDTGLNNYCYFLYDEEKNPYVTSIATDNYHGALGAEERFLNRFEFFRMTLNSTRNLAAYYVTGDATQKGEIAKWVLDKSIAPYPILKVHAKYPSIVNPDTDHATTKTERNKGGLLGTLTVAIRDSENDAVFGAPTGAAITTDSKDLNITDKDEDNFNFNYKKVQLPYYNDVGTGNYTGGRVVTGWKIVEINGSSTGKGNFVKTGTDAPAFNFVDRTCTNKDLYSVSGRVFAQGAYWEVPDSVTSITIEPYWAKAVYLSDANYDMTYTITISGTGSNSTATANKYGVTVCGACPGTCNGQTVYTDLATAMTNLGSNTNDTPYDYAVVLVGNYHQAANDALVDDGSPVTFMSADLDGDNEPDNTLFYYHNQRRSVSPIRFDFLNIPGIGMVKRTYDSSMDPEPGIFVPQGWFEITNTVFVRFGQFEYAGSNSFLKTTMAPLILQGGIYEQFVSCCRTNAQNTNYLLIGGNAWFLNFANGCHTAQANKTPKVPINVTGGDYTNFYLTGIYQPATNEASENAECYIDGGRFKEVAGSGMQQIKGSVTWLINAADITSFYGGGINAAKPITGSISTTITNSYVDEFYGGPKFGDMTDKKTVTTNATDCHFGKYFGAGYGGTAFNRVGYKDESNANNSRTWDTWVNTYYDRNYSGDNSGISTSYEYEFILHSDGNQTVARFFVNYASLSLASTRNVTNTLSGCTIGTFYGGGSLGAVKGDVNSTLTDCKVTGNAFGAGFSASVPTVEVWNAEAYLAPKPKYNRTANVFNNASVKTPKDKDEFVVYTWSKTYGTNDEPLVVTEDGKHYIHTEESLDNLGAVTGSATLTIEGSTTVGGSVYGGGDESAVNGGTNIVLTEKAIIGNDEDGTGDIYGGGNVASVGGNTQISLKGGTVIGDVYGGGKGRLAAEAVGTEGQPGYKPAVTAVAATVGAATVELNTTEVDNGNGTKSYPDSCVVKGRLFGCNNLNGTPLGAVTVHVQKTCGYTGHYRTGHGLTDADDIEAALENIDDTQHSYEVEAVYGGGNLAAYVPTDLVNGKTHVIIDGCDLTSVRQVYGGGNAASAPAAWVEINGTYEIEEVFGGGNGKDDISRDGGTTNIKNPGANVGFKDYWDYENECDLAAYDTKQERQTDDFIDNYVYGSGEATVNINGGRIHRVYGGSNTKGNVREIAVTMLEETGGCDFVVDEAYGGGKSASMDGQSKLEMACIPGLKNAYGGAENANINNDVTLNITNGNFNRVFGGNNVSGTINGTITVNIEETGCHHITIGQLYGGGNQAPYTGPLKSGSNTERQGPTLNVRSFSSIGEVYGGGYGKTATVTGDTYVNINVCDGKDFGANQTTELARTNTFTGNKTISFAEFRRTDDGGFALDNQNNRIIDYRTLELYLPPFTSGIGGINNVYGGGNAAKVIGNTHVNIGTTTGESVVFITPTSESLDANRTHTVKGANIVGNIYGGGNAARVTGKTKVQIGKKILPAGD